MTERPDMNGERPVICVDLLDGCNPQQWQQVWYGLEEEGIPFHLQAADGHDLVVAAYQAAQRAPLQVGIACSPTEIVVHNKNLPTQTPLFRLAYQPRDAIRTAISTDSTDADPAETLRALGCNAARLVKGIPFK